MAHPSQESQQTLHAVSSYTANTVELINSLTQHCDSQLQALHNKLQLLDRSLLQLEQQFPDQEAPVAHSEKAGASPLGSSSQQGAFGKSLCTDIIHAEGAHGHLHCIPVSQQRLLNISIEPMSNAQHVGIPCSFPGLAY